MSTTLNVNGKMVTVDVSDDTRLLWTLRDVLGMTGTKFGSGMALLVDVIEPEVQEFLALHGLYAFLYDGSSLAAPGAFSERATEPLPRGCSFASIVLNQAGRVRGRRRDRQVLF